MAKSKCLKSQGTLQLALQKSIEPRVIWGEMVGLEKTKTLGFNMKSDLFFRSHSATKE
jgi:hypothetical protein